MAEIIDKLTKISWPFSDLLDYISALKPDHIHNGFAKIKIKFNFIYSKNPASPLLGLIKLQYFAHQQGIISNILQSLSDQGPFTTIDTIISAHLFHKSYGLLALDN